MRRGPTHPGNRARGSARTSVLMSSTDGPARQVWKRRESGSARLDLGKLLAAVEDAPPVSAVDDLDDRLRHAIGADDVSFLIADFSGQALIRLEHAGSKLAARTQGRETAERVPLMGTPPGRALAGQPVVVEAGGVGGGTRLYAPVPNRGGAIGLIELHPAAAP